jgi:Na+-transporting NADH:ubiquinone oxidoreductase subunit NqrD
VVSFVGFTTGVTSAMVGAMVSITKALTLRIALVLPAASVTVIVQLLCKPSPKALRVIVLLPITAEDVADEQSPP